MPAEIVSVALGAGAVGAAIGLLAGIALSCGARIPELRDFWRRGYAYAKREAAWRARWDAYGASLGPPPARDHDAMAEPFGDVTLVPEPHRHG
jgi:hypothetical protein